MPDPYLYEDVPVLRNKLGIKVEKTLDVVEAEQSRANMMLLYEQGFSDFSPTGLCEIHRFLFGDIYDWAGQYRIMNIEKAERLLGGRSIWYSNDDNIARDLLAAFSAIKNFDWDKCSREEFVAGLTRLFPPIWQVHPFREGNTRAVVMLMTLFVEAHGYFFDIRGPFQLGEHVPIAVPGKDTHRVFRMPVRFPVRNLTNSTSHNPDCSPCRGRSNRPRYIHHINVPPYLPDEQRQKSRLQAPL